MSPGEVPHQRLFVVLANAGDVCTIQTRTRNPSYPVGVSVPASGAYGKTPSGADVRPEFPKLHLERMATLEPGAHARTGVQQDYEYHFYPFHAVIGEEHHFSTSLPLNAALDDVVMEVWGPNGIAKDTEGRDVTNSDHTLSHNEPLAWTADEGGMHFLLVRAGHPPDEVPPEGGYQLSWRLPAIGCSPSLPLPGNSRDSSDSVTARAAASCSVQAPTGLQTSTTANSITLTWTRVAGITYEAKHPDLSVHDTDAASSHLFSTLSSSTNYTVFVRAKDVNGNKSMWTAATAYTLLPTPTIQTPITTSSSITVTWNTVSGATSYDLKRVASSGNCDDVGVDGDTTLLTFTFDRGLTASTDYVVCVRARDLHGASAWALTPARTRPAVVSPPIVIRPRGVECLSSTDPGILVAVDNDCVTIRASRMLIDLHGEGHDEIWRDFDVGWHTLAQVCDCQ